jgi:hypothetical protein
MALTARHVDAPGVILVIKWQLIVDWAQHPTACCAG